MNSFEEVKGEDYFPDYDELNGSVEEDADLLDAGIGESIQDIEDEKNSIAELDLMAFEDGNPQ